VESPSPADERMRTALLTPLVAAVAAAATTVQRFVVPLLLEFDVDAAGPTYTRYALGARFLSFLLVYGALLGVAYLVGSQTEDRPRLPLLSAATFAVATAVALVTTAAILLTIQSQPSGLLQLAGGTLGQSLSTGVQLAVVAFAGAAAGRL